MISDGIDITDVSDLRWPLPIGTSISVARPWASTVVHYARFNPEEGAAIWLRKSEGCAEGIV